MHVTKTASIMMETTPVHARMVTTWKQMAQHVQVQYIEIYTGNTHGMHSPEICLD